MGTGAGAGAGEGAGAGPIKLLEVRMVVEIVVRVSEAPLVMAYMEYQRLVCHSAKDQDGFQRAELFELVGGTCFAGEPLGS